MKREPKQHPSEIDEIRDLPSEETEKTGPGTPADPDLPSMEVIDLTAEPENATPEQSGSGDADPSADAPEESSEGSAPSEDTPAESVPETPSRASRRAAVLARKKKKADMGLSAALSLLFFACMLAITIFLLAVPRSTSSAVERRSLAQWPTFTVKDYFESRYTSAVTEYFDDTVPARDIFKNIGNNIRSMFGITSSGSVEVIGNIQKADDAAPAAPAEEVTTAAETETVIADQAADEEETTQPSSKDYHIENLDVIDENGYLVVLQDGHWRAFALYVGVDVSLYANTVNYIRQMIDPSVNIYVMPAPLAAQFYIPSNYLEYHEDMENTYRDLSSRLGSGITPVDSIPVLNEHNTEAIYLRTDHHWAHLGAYYAAGEFAKAAGVPFADLDTYEKNVREGYVGTMYGLTGSANLLNDPEDFEYFLPSASYIVDYYDQSLNFLFRKGLFFDTILSESYGMVLGEDDLIIHVKTGTENGRKLLIVKDSYGNATVPFLTSSFEEIYIIDQRFFDFNLIDFINKINVTDILFVHDYYSLTGAESELLEYITYSNLDTEIPDFMPEAEVPENGNPDINNTEILYASDILGYTPERHGTEDEEEEETAAEDDVGYTEDYAYEYADEEEPEVYYDTSDTGSEDTDWSDDTVQDTGEDWQ